MAGILYGVGVGPGDPELLTLKAVKIIRECDMIGIPAGKKDTCTAYQIAQKAVPEIEGKPVIPVAVPMTTDPDKLKEAYRNGTSSLEDCLEKGKKIAFLNLGDPTIYGSYMVIHEQILKDGYQAELISGIPSFCAVAAALNLSLGARRENIHILPGCYDESDVNAYNGTKILMKSAGKIEKVKEQLISLEESGSCKASAVSNCGMENEKIYPDIRQLEEDAGYFTTIIIKDCEA
jgi:precorrin-2/cobalt-factor-2 C20-methyltransferase